MEGGVSMDEAIELLTGGEFTSLADFQSQFTDGKIPGMEEFLTEDRKSTRLNSSHANISYAVFCLKKKTWLLRSVFSSCCLARDFGLLPGWDTALPWSSAVLDW